MGKTLTACHAMKKAVVVLAEPDGLSTVSTHLGYEPAHIELLNIDSPEEELKQVTKVLKPKLMSKEFTGVILDTGSELSSRLADSYADRWPTNKFGKFDFAMREIKRFVRNMQVTPAVFVMLCHEKKPSMADQIFYKGGPVFSTNNMAQAMCGMFSLVLRATYIQGKGRVFQCMKNTTQWFMGDRYGATADEQPLDLRPILWRIMKGDAPMPELPPLQLKTVELPPMTVGEEVTGEAL
jgi:hypothetical protein